MPTIFANDPNFAARLELLITPDDVIYCRKCREWHTASPFNVGVSWDSIIDHGYPIARPCNLPEALDCMTAGQNMVALDYPLPWVWLSRNDTFGAVALSEIETPLERVKIFSGEIMIPFRPRETFRRTFSQLKRWIPYNPEYPTHGK